MSAKPVTFKVGNLIYTKRGLFALFAWLLWFDFLFTIIEGVLDPIITTRLKNELNMNAFWYQTVLTILPGFINFFLNPIVSIKSDRHRGPRGRRIPFLLWGSPVVCASLVLLGFGNEIAAWLHGTVFASRSPDEVAIWTFSGLFIVFFVSNMLIGTTFYYLFNDVVPEQHLMKFLSYMRVAGGLAGILMD